MFHCQRCTNPINIDESLLNMNAVQVNLLKDHHARRLTESNDDQDDDEIDELDPSQFISKDKLDIINSIGDEQPIIYNNDIDKNHHDKRISISTSLTSNSFVMVSDGEQDIVGHNDDNQDNINDHDNKDHDITDNPINNEAIIAKNNKLPELSENDHHPGLISSRLKILNKVFDILSINNEIDHPLCQDCSKLLIDNYKLKFDQSQTEKDYYLNFLKKLRDQKDLKQLEHDDPKLINALNEFKALKQQEIEKLNELEGLEDTKMKLDKQLIDLKHEFEVTKKNDLNNILTVRNDLMFDLSINLNKLDSIKHQYQVNLNHLDNLRNFNIYTQFFKISCDEKNQFATINGFRLGYKISWGEINSAMGQIILLLNFLTKRLNFKLVNYKLVPLGSQSQIIKISNNENNSPNPDETKTKTVLNLYSSNEFSVGKLFNFNKFDISMIALLDIVHQIQAKIVLLDQELELPYKISNKRDTIGGKSIRITSNGEWTESCKFLLTNLNWMLVYTSVHTTPSNI